MSGPSHCSPVGDSLWKAKRPLVRAGPLGDEAGGLEQLVAVRIVLVEDARRERVRGEDDVLVLLKHEPLREELDEAGVGAPALDEAQLGAAGERVDELRAVLLDRQRRVVRREHEADDRVGAARQRLLDGLRDPRRPVAHAGEDRQRRAPPRAPPASPR